MDYKEYSDFEYLSPEKKQLVADARKAVENAYAPYSNFRVACSILLDNGKTIIGNNVENASYPVGICAERAALSAVVSQYPEQKIIALAVCYRSPRGKSDTPIFPCGMCRQFLLEMELRNKEPMILLLSGMEGKVFELNKITELMPQGFSARDLF